MYCFCGTREPIVGRLMGTDIVFDGLPVGDRYWVGPIQDAPGVLFAADTHQDVSWLSVRPNKATEVAWNPRWSDYRLRGRIHVTGPEPALFVEPEFGPTLPTVLAGSRTERYSIAEDGSFDVSLPSTPARVRVGMWVGATGVPISFVPDDGVCQIGFARVKLRLPDDEPLPTDVHLEWRPDLGPSVAHKFDAVVDVRGHTTRVVDLGLLPINVSSLDIRLRRGARQVFFRLRAGEDAVIDVPG